MEDYREVRILNSDEVGWKPSDFKFVELLGTEKGEISGLASV